MIGSSDHRMVMIGSLDGHDKIIWWSIGCHVRSIRSFDGHAFEGSLDDQDRIFGWPCSDHRIISSNYILTCEVSLWIKDSRSHLQTSGYRVWTKQSFIFSITAWWKSVWNGFGFIAHRQVCRWVMKCSPHSMNTRYYQIVTNIIFRTSDRARFSNWVRLFPWQNNLCNHAWPGWRIFRKLTKVLMCFYIVHNNGWTLE